MKVLRRVVMLNGRVPVFIGARFRIFSFTDVFDTLGDAKHKKHTRDFQLISYTC